MPTKIEWTEETWNPTVGCSKVSDGCKNCYAFELHDKRHKAWQNGTWANTPKQYHKPFTDIQLFYDRLDKPLKWKKPRIIFVNSMSDLFHEDVPDDFICEVWTSMAAASHHIFQVLTKRPERMRDWLNNYGPVYGTLKNVWLGVTAENKATADERIKILLQTPAAVRFLSLEPLLGPIDLYEGYGAFRVGENGVLNQGVDWVIVGGESGPGARPMHPDWVRDIRDQCMDADVNFFFKQWGEWTSEFPQKLNLANRQITYQQGETFYKVGKKQAGRTLDGRTWDEYPGWLMR